MAAEPTLINSVIRALTLLETVGDAGRPVTAKQLSRLTDIPLPTAYHLLRTLVHEGYLVRSDGGYVMGDQVGHLARAQRANAIPQRARHVLRTLQQQLGAAAYLAFLDDGEIDIVDIVDAPGAPRTDLWVGLHEAAHATALGKAILGALPDERRADYLARHPLLDLTPHTHTNRRALLAELDAEPGIAVDIQEYALGTTCIAAAVPGSHAVGAVAVSLPTTNLDTALAHRSTLRRAASLLSLALEADRLG
ncbi:IclR family transcriptional regulator [Propioniciclava coleopterorum]|uniref:IclR family transcriptional regulator n=1 Tax=Propioniciclava coleopterorum TaxID=2714937 RepID=A0A6G7Y725_9ACTN|nr:IclR family transcriptional regulator [Propioniciclava coleopterorum]QIK72590.1 IclR family transcriptional regulator [Propioniciclava coleopterorum]